MSSGAQQAEAPDAGGGQDLGRRLSTAVIMFHQAVAEKLGVNATDLRCAELLARHGAMTAGQLAALTGLETGSTTTVIDRLERASLARRDRDLQDRRKVIIHPVMDREEELGRLYAGLARPMGELMAHYDAHQLSAILEFLTGTIGVLEEQAARLRAEK